MDFIQQLGALAFGSRLRRLSDRLMKDVARIYREYPVNFEPRWFPVLYLLKDGSPRGVTEIARELGFTHPAVNQIAGAMERRKLLGHKRDPSDDRRRLLYLTADGQDLVQKLAPVWSAIAAATDEVIQASSCDILKALSDMEAALDEAPLYDKVQARLEAPRPTR